jgi:hypothetical protein
MTMTPKQVELLFTAAQTPFLNDEQRATLKLDNPYKHQGRVAEALQREVVRINPLQARLWAKEAGATMSLAAAAAQQGLAQMTPGLADEISRMNPQTEQERLRGLVAEATKNGNPYQREGSYSEEGKYQEAPFNLTAALMLEAQAPEEAARLKKAATPQKPAHAFTDREAALLSMHGYSLPTHSS